jgi:hypothetical protein
MSAGVAVTAKAASPDSCGWQQNSVCKGCFLSGNRQKPLKSSQNCISDRQSSYSTDSAVVK